jgi:cytochrome c peroxidase
MSSGSGRGRRAAGLARGIACVLAALATTPLTAAAVERSREPVWPAALYDYRPQLPAYAPTAGLPAVDGRWNARAKLGRALFYDRALSRNGLVSCGSCHEQQSGFDDPTRFSIGFAGRITRRSAMALGNALFNPAGAYFRDRRAPNLEAQVLAPFTDAIEMGLAEGELEARVAATAWYAPLFSEAFGDAGVTGERVAAALATFVRSMTSFAARYDIARASAASPFEDFAAFDAAENRGKFLFFAGRGQGGGGCAACHETEAFIMTGARDNGLPPLPGKADGGVGEVTGRAADMGLFRAPSLRNVAVSAPYMRDGRFADLAAVVDHYSQGVAATANLDPLLAGPDGAPAPLRLSAADRDALVAFLKTLTDAAFLADRRFADPFQR